MGRSPGKEEKTNAVTRNAYTTVDLKAEEKRARISDNWPAKFGGHGELRTHVPLMER